jgi:glyoxylase-like metal-dependent hydrolase (beta-lactamase superfamily II)
VNIYDHLETAVDVYPLGPLGSGTNVGIVSRGNSGIVIDAPPYSKEMILGIAEKKSIKLQYLFITHSHWDHIGDAALLKKCGLRIYAHELDRQIIEDPEKTEPKMRAYWPIDACSVDYVINDDDAFSVCGLSIQALWIPGHSPGGIAYCFKDLDICFVGDTLFYKTIGRSDFPGGNKQLLFKNIRNKLYALPDETIVIPGHGRLTTIGEEKNKNPYVRPRS